MVQLEFHKFLREQFQLMDDLKDFNVNRVWIEGKLVAEAGVYLPTIEKYDISSVKGSVVLKDFSKDLELSLLQQFANHIFQEKQFFLHRIAFLPRYNVQNRQAR